MPQINYISWDDENSNKTITSRFAKVVGQIPGNVALIDQQRSYSFAEIDEISDRIALHIQYLGVPQKSPVAVLFGPSVFRIAGLIGVLKSGRPFVPLDITYPIERNKLIFDDSGSFLLCTDNFCERTASLIINNEKQIVNLDRLPDHSNQKFQTVRILPDDLSVIIYTSGSTGRPKGVKHTHQSVLYDAMITSLTLDIRICDRFIQVSPTGSVASLSQTTSSVLSGAVSLPFSLRHQGLHEFGQWILQQNITIYSSAPTIFRHLCQEFPNENTFSSFRIVRSGGEQVFESDLDLCLKHCNSTTLFQIAYGSSETGIITTKNYQPAQYLKSLSGKIPIGSVVQGKKIQILDENMISVSQGETGELYVGSVGLAQGYLGQDSLTSEKFITLPEANGKSDRYYKTGDLVRQLSNGDMEFAGRIDVQMKINGFRIEPGEIEATLLQNQSISECLVKKCSFNDQDYLVAYLSVHRDQKITENDLRAFLFRKLPVHMVPRLYVFLDKFPRVPNGKIDRQALPEPKITQSFLSSGDAILHQNTLILLDIWKKLLKIDDISPETNFFEAGGDSLLMMKMIEEISKYLNIKIEIASIIQNPTIEKISLILGKDQHHGDIELIKLGAVNNEVPLVIVGPGAFVYHLADEMKQSRPVYAFTLPNYVEVLAWKDDAAMITVDKLATIYTDLILKHIPAGRLMLAGHSFHGIIAFEVAHQLIKSGKNIEMIVMFDTKLKKQYPKLLPRMLYFTKNIRPDLAIKALILRVFAFKKSSGNKKNDYKISKPKVGMQEINSALSRLSETKELMVFSEFSKYANAIRRSAFSQHLMEPVNSKGLLVRVSIKETEIINSVFPDYGWRNCFKGGLKIIETEGDHISMLRPPNHHVLAKQLNEELSIF